MSTPRLPPSICDQFKFRNKNEQHRHERYVGIPQGCFKCRWTGLTHLHETLREDFTIEEYETEVDRMIYCECALGESKFRREVLRQLNGHCPDDVYAKAWNAQKECCKKASRQVARYNSLCAEKAKRGW